MGGVATAVAVSVGVALMALGAGPGRSRRAGRAADHHRGAVPPALTWKPTTRRCSRRSRKCRQRSRHRPTSKPYRRTSTPTYRRGSRKKALFHNGCMRNFFEGGQPECATGDTASTTTVALVGDSHAAMWHPAFQQIATQRHWRLETLTKGACPLLDLRIINPSLRREYTEM